MLKVLRRDRPLVPEGDHASYRAFVRRGFGRRQAPLRSALRPLVPPLALKRLGRELGFAADAHARDLDAHQWAALYGLLARSGARFVRPAR